MLDQPVEHEERHTQRDRESTATGSVQLFTALSQVIDGPHAAVWKQQLALPVCVALQRHVNTKH